MTGFQDFLVGVLLGLGLSFFELRIARICTESCARLHGRCGGGCGWFLNQEGRKAGRVGEEQ
jgi:hypothetical protein